MKFLHGADLHLGKKVHQFSMVDLQEHILSKMVEIALDEQVQGILLCGDIYDKPLPSEEAVGLLDRFLNRCKKEKLPVYMISGNHDSSRRLAFGNQIMAAEKIHIASAFEGKMDPIVLHDEYGEMNLYMLPFIKPAQVRFYYPDEPGDNSYQWALDTVMKHTQLNTDKRNLLLAHQFVLGGVTSESEELSVGGLDQITPDTFKSFDYVALGHLHRPQSVGAENIRYAGSPLKYSFSEAGHQKSVTIVILHEKGSLHTKQVPLVPLYDMKELKGSFHEVMTLGESYYRQSYLRITLTDEQDIPNAFGRLAVVYPKLMQLSYDNSRTRQLAGEPTAGFGGVRQNPLALFEQLYQGQMGIKVTEEQQAYLTQITNEIWEEKL